MAELSAPCPFDLLRSRLECMLDAPASPESSPGGSRRASVSCPLPPIARTTSYGTSSSASSTCSDAASASGADTPTASPVAGTSGRSSSSTATAPIRIAAKKRIVRFADEVTHLGPDPGSLRRASYAGCPPLPASSHHQQQQQQQQPATPSPTPVMGVEEKADQLRSRLESLWGGRFGSAPAPRAGAHRGAACMVAA